MAAQRKRAVLLDALGTLLALEPPAPRLRDELARRFGVEVSERDAGLAVRAEIDFYRDNVWMGGDRAGLERLRDVCAELVCERLPRSLPVAGVREALLAAIRFTPYPDVVPALRELRGRGMRLVVVSNWDISLHDALAATGLDALVDGALASAQFGTAKPDPAIFTAGLRIAGVAPDEALHVGDSVEADVAGAIAAGVAPVLLVRDADEHPPTSVGAAAPSHVIRSLAELPPLCG